MATLGIGEEEQLAMFRTISGILHFGNIEVKQRPREEWATIPTTTGEHGEREGGREGGREKRGEGESGRQINGQIDGH